MSNIGRPVTATPAQPVRPWNSPGQQQINGMVPFVLPQVLFPGTNTQVKMGQGLLAKVAYTSASTNVVVTHNLGHPINCAWVVMAPISTFHPLIAITSNTTKTVTLQFSTVANPVTVALF